MKRPLACGALLVCMLTVPATAGEASPAIDPSTLLPPQIPWDGASRSLVADRSDPWLTPAEASAFSRTPGYRETFDWLARLAKASSRVHMEVVGRSWEQRDLWLIVATADGASTPAELQASGKPILFAQAGIHSGEIDGKDAGLMFLRDLVMGDLAPLLERASFLFLPILNVDGHERISPFSRVNQRGPDEMGWRTNARNLNLNRDYAKLDTPEVRAVVAVLDRWRPDLYLDLHVTDGIEKQYDITWGYNGSHGHSPAIGEWLESSLDPALTRDLEAMGHIPGPHVFVFDRSDPAKGIWAWEGGPRYSDGYGSARHIATVLVENHSLKPYEQRVLGTRVLLQSALECLADEGAALRQASRADRKRRRPQVPLGWDRDQQPEEDPFAFLAVESVLSDSSISGAKRVQWTGEPITIQVPLYRTTRPIGAVTPPAAYWVPAAWSDVIERLVAHGIEMTTLERPTTVEVEKYRLDEPRFAEELYEGHLRVAADVAPFRTHETFPQHSVRIPADQPLGVLVSLLLEPSSPDSFFQWGFFNQVFQRTEYAESYVLEPLAEQMLADDPALRAEFETRLAEDEEFAASPRQRLYWFYERSPLLDERWRVYPVAREMP